MKRLREDNPNTQHYWDTESVARGWLEQNWNHHPGDIPWKIMRHISFGDSVLDVGCGSGMITRRLKEIRPNLYIAACDFSNAAVKFLGPKLPINELWQCDVRNGIPRGNGAYDVVLSTEVIEHMEDPAAFVAELARVARKKVIITTPYGDKICNSGEHIWAFWLDDIYELFKPYGIVNLTVGGGNSNIVAACYLRQVKP